MKLTKFLIKAKIATYASLGETSQSFIDDNFKELTYHDNKYKYLDRYYGFNPFSGNEIVWENDDIIWSMNYFGKVYSNNISCEKVYEFLQSALRQVKEDRPFRGPNYFKMSDFEYIDESVGDIIEFTGVERILYKEYEIYRLNYHGGSM